MSSQPKRAKTWHVPMSSKAQRTTNPIRSIVDKIMMQKREPIPGKPMIPLSLGDPCSFGNLNAPDVMTEAVVKIIQEKKHNGYGASPGINSAREAIAQKFSTPNCKYKMDDIIIGSGCSGALEIALCGLLDDGDNVLVPRPGFPLYQVLAESHGAHVKQYDLLPEKNWQADPAQAPPPPPNRRPRTPRGRQMTATPPCRQATVPPNHRASRGAACRSRRSSTAARAAS